jgi:hypothetical protein
VSVPRCDRTVTDGELRALLGPMFALGDDDAFDVAVVVSSPQGGQMAVAVRTTAGHDPSLLAAVAQEMGIL